MELFDLGFLSVRLLDVIDILLVAALIYTLFKIIRGSIALNVFIGILTVYILWFVVRAANMRLLSLILGQFIGVGVIALLIVFQQEIRRFLLLLGKNRVVFGSDRPWKNVLPWNWRNTQNTEINFDELALVCRRLSQTQTGAIIVLARSGELKFFATTGIALDANVNAKLLESIFLKRSPLHDGAVVIVKNKIKAASCILPVSESTTLPAEYGLRHRSALGIAEQTDGMAITVSEETGRITVASKSVISGDISGVKDLSRRLFEEYFEIAPTENM